MPYNPRKTPGRKPTKYAPLLATILVLSPWVTLVACSSGTPTSGIDSGTTQEVAAVKTSAWDGFCAIAKRVGWSSKDTPETVLEIKQHNHLGALHCGWPE